MTDTQAIPQHNHAWGGVQEGVDPAKYPTGCSPRCPAYLGADALDIVRTDRVPPRECVRAARDALTKAYGVSDSRLTWPFMLEALDWLRRGIEQIAQEIP